MRKLWIFVLCFALLAGCKNWGTGKHRKKLKILNSFSHDMVLSRIWLDLFSEFQQKYPKTNALAMNVKPSNLLYRLRKMIMLQTLPNLVYIKPNNLAASYLIDQDLLQNLRAELDLGHLSELELFPPAMTPQGHGEDTLWFLPMKINISNVLFVNEQVLLQEGLKVPRSIGEMKQSIALLRARGYEYPLLAHSSYVEHILHNLLSTLVARRIEPDFFDRAAEEPGLYQSSRFRSVLEEYTSYLQEDGILPPAVRSLEAGLSLQLFNLGAAAFMLAAPDVSEFFAGGENSDFRDSIRWEHLPVPEDLIGGKRERIAAGHLEPGYGITSSTAFSPELQKQAIQFIDFMFSDGLERYAAEDVSFPVFSVPLPNSGADWGSSYARKKNFYRSRSLIIDDIAENMKTDEYELLMETMEKVVNGAATLDQVVSLFQSNAMRLNRHEHIAKREVNSN